MGDRASAERACREQNPVIDGRKANVNLAILGAKPRGNVQAGECCKHVLLVVLLRLQLQHAVCVKMDRRRNVAQLHL